MDRRVASVRARRRNRGFVLVSLINIIDAKQACLISNGEISKFYSAVIVRTPPFGYRVMLSTLRPMHRIDYDWSEQEGMRRLLKDPGNYNRLVRLQIEKSSIVDRIIVASDMFGRDSGKSFVEDCVAMRFGVRLSTNLTMLQDPMTASPVFCPRPRNRPVFEIYQSRSEKFRCLYNSNKSNDDGSRIMQFTFTEIFSPLEVHFVPLLDDLKGVTLMMSTDSVNCRPLDYQLASNDDNF